MNYICHRTLRLAARNEGKIKSYESCTDVRAWSHNIWIRSSYFRDWIKSDMPICVVPVTTLSSILSIMTCRSRGRVSSRCHSGCQSKVLLDRLCSSCTVMKDCLSYNREFEKYLKEEDLETIHWPCDKCLEIFKSIKTFWKIVIEKVLNIHLPRSNEYKCTHICSLRNITREWQKEMVEEATFVKSKILLSEQNDTIRKEIDANNRFAVGENTCFYNNCQTKETETDCDLRNIGIQTDKYTIRQNISKCTSASIKMVNLECESSNQNNDVIMIYKNNILNIQQQFDLQKNEVDRLKKENTTLNIELQRIRQKCSKSNFHGDTLNTHDDTVALISSSIDLKEKYDSDRAKDIDSEMIITLKNCENEDYQHVSVIQVMHKTNKLINSPEVNGSHYEKEDPIDILKKVHNVFESMVKREISIATTNNKSLKNQNVVIKTTFNDVCGNKAPSFYSTSSYSVMSEWNFVNESTNRMYGTSTESRT